MTFSIRPSSSSVVASWLLIVAGFFTAPDDPPPARPTHRRSQHRHIDRASASRRPAGRWDRIAAVRVQRFQGVGRNLHLAASRSRNDS